MVGNLESPVKNCPRVSLICLSESVRRGSILIGFDTSSSLIFLDQDQGKINTGIFFSFITT